MKQEVSYTKRWQKILCPLELAQNIVAFLDQAAEHALKEGQGWLHCDIALSCAQERSEEDLPHTLNPSNDDAFSRNASMRHGFPWGGYQICPCVHSLHVDHNRILPRLEWIANAIDSIRDQAWSEADQRMIFPPNLDLLLRPLQVAAREVFVYLRGRARKPWLPAQLYAHEGSQVAAERVAWRLLVQATCLLPHEHRGRFFEEFQSELLAMAEARVPLTRRLLYMACQMRHIVQLRTVLQFPLDPPFSGLRRAACWILASDWRTWGLLGPLMAFAIVNVFLQQGWGSAFFTIPAVVAFYAGTEWLRSRWGVSVKPRKRGRNTTVE
ncbi:hypothetical protein ABT158_03900 [Nonomuraea sp. NPDC001636]|uniref:hypothetical protein n=1 Tax=Nonomuraea sp. NPDC001636 TaxID=3154391 RepID=UPI003325B5E0